MNWFIIILSGLLILDQTIGLSVDVEVNVNADCDEKKGCPSAGEKPTELLGGSSAGEKPAELLATQTGCYLGCYVDYPSPSRLLPDFKVSSQYNSPWWCMKVCTNRNYTYAGMEVGSECWCGNQNPPIEHKTRDWECNMSCTGAPHYNCGGPWRISIYSKEEGCLPNADVTAPSATVQG